MKILFRLSLLVILIQSSAKCFAETPDTTAERSLIASVDYGTNKIFYGRRLTVNQVYLSPSFFYEAPSGFFAGLAGYHLLSPANRWDETDLNAGWDFSFTKSVKGSAGYTRFRYASTKSNQTYSLLNNGLEFYLKQENKIVNPKLVFDYLFGNSTHDLSLALHLTHEFEFYELFDSTDALILKPVVLLTAGTLNYYKLTLRDSTQKLSLRNAQLQTYSKFNFSGAEFSLGAEYDIGRFIFEPAGHYNIPLNQPKYLNASSFFYFTMGIGYKIIG